MSYTGPSSATVMSNNSSCPLAKLGRSSPLYHRSQNSPTSNSPVSETYRSTARKTSCSPSTAPSYKSVDSYHFSCSSSSSAGQSSYSKDGADIHIVYNDINNDVLPLQPFSLAPRSRNKTPDTGFRNSPVVDNYHQSVNRSSSPTLKSTAPYDEYNHKSDGRKSNSSPFHSYHINATKVSDKYDHRDSPVFETYHCIAPRAIRSSPPFDKRHKSCDDVMRESPAFEHIHTSVNTVNRSSGHRMYHHCNDNIDTRAPPSLYHSYINDSEYEDNDGAVLVYPLDFPNMSADPVYPKEYAQKNNNNYNLNSNLRYKVNTNCHEFNVTPSVTWQRPAASCNYLVDQIGKMGRSSPSLDQGYHTLVSPSPGPSTPGPGPGPWMECNNKNVFKGKTKVASKNNYFSLLPDNAVLKIFAWLNSSELCICAQVCRRFEHLVWDPTMWRNVTLKGPSFSGDKAIRNILQKLCGHDLSVPCSTIEKIFISEGAKLTDKGLIMIARQCIELTHLQVQGCAMLNNSALYELTSKCHNLQHLDITGCLRLSGLAAPNISRKLMLQYLDLTDCTSIDDHGLRIIVENCPQLIYLYLRRCVQITDAGIKCVPSFCSALRELSISDCANLTDFGLYELAKLGSTLRYLSVAKCDRVSDPGLKVIVRRCYKLRYLNARGCEAVSDDAITVLARSCPRLRALDIGKCDVSDAGLSALAESCPNLKKLSLRNCELVTDKGVQYIAYYCRGLQLLNIQDCQITIEGYRAVKKYCKRCVIEHTNPGFF